MASINISEGDFEVVAGAALDAKAKGDMDAARALDKIARKINAALSHNCAGAKIARMAGGTGKAISWTDVPSVLDT